MISKKNVKKFRTELELWIENNKNKSLHLLEISKLFQIITQYYEVIEY